MFYATAGSSSKCAGTPSLAGVNTVKVNGTPAAVYYIQPDQVNFQVPAGVSGMPTVQVLANGVASNTPAGAVVSNSPGIFPIVEGAVF